MKKIKISFNAPVTLGLVTICFFATLMGVLTGGKTTRLLFMTYHSSLHDPLTYLRFVTHIFGHSGWDHFIGNAMYLLLLGPLLEEKYGYDRILKVVLITAVATSLINYIFFPSIALCGASGVVFAFIILASFTGFREGEIPLTFLLVAAIFIGQQVYEGFAIKDNVSNMAHIIGGVVGAVIGFQFNRRKR